MTRLPFPSGALHRHDTRSPYSGTFLVRPHPLSHPSAPPRGAERHGHTTCVGGCYAYAYACVSTPRPRLPSKHPAKWMRRGAEGCGRVREKGGSGEGCGVVSFIPLLSYSLLLSPTHSHSLSCFPSIELSPNLSHSCLPHSFFPLRFTSSLSRILSISFISSTLSYFRCLSYSFLLVSHTVVSFTRSLSTATKFLRAPSPK